MDIYLCRIIHKAQHKTVKSEQYTVTLRRGMRMEITWTFGSTDT